MTGGPTFAVLDQNGDGITNQTGNPTSPPNADVGGWGLEITMDVEWAHAVAPKANIILFEANSNLLPDLMTAVHTAADFNQTISGVQNNVSVVSG